MQVQFLHEERICIPLGAAIGAITGATLLTARRTQRLRFKRVSLLVRITGILNERWRPAPGSGGRPPETDSDTPGGWGGGGRSVFGFGDERPAAAAGSGTPGGGSGVGGGWLGTSNSGGVFGSTPRGGGPDAGSGSNSPAGAAFREEKGAALGGGAAALPSVTLGDSAPLHPAALGRRLVAGGGGAAAAAGADDFDPFQSAHH